MNTQTASGGVDSSAVLLTAHSVTLSTGKSVAIRKVTLRTFGPVLSFLRTVLDGLDVQGGMPMIDLLSPGPVLKLISENLDAAYDTTVLLSDTTKDELLDMDMEDSLRVILKIVEVNRTFFIEKLQPLLAPLLAEAKDG